MRDVLLQRGKPDHTAEVRVESRRRRCHSRLGPAWPTHRREFAEDCSLAASSSGRMCRLRAVKPDRLKCERIEAASEQAALASMGTAVPKAYVSFALVGYLTSGRVRSCRWPAAFFRTTTVCLEGGCSFPCPSARASASLGPPAATARSGCWAASIRGSAARCAERCEDRNWPARASIRIPSQMDLAFGPSSQGTRESSVVDVKVGAAALLGGVASRPVVPVGCEGRPLDVSDQVIAQSRDKRGFRRIHAQRSRARR